MHGFKDMVPFKQRLISEIRGSMREGMPQELDVLKIERDQGMEKAERELVEILRRVGIIGPDYQGEVILHFSQGGLSDIDRVEKSIKRRLEKKSK